MTRHSFRFLFALAVAVLLGQQAPAAAGGYARLTYEHFGVKPGVFTGTYRGTVSGDITGELMRVMTEFQPTPSGAIGTFKFVVKDAITMHLDGTIDRATGKGFLSGHVEAASPSFRDLVGSRVRVEEQLLDPATFRFRGTIEIYPDRHRGPFDPVITGLQVPFQGRILAPPSAPIPIMNQDRGPGLLFPITGPVLTSHHGPFTTVQHHIIYPAENPLVGTDGVYTFTARDGDQLWGRYVATNVPTSDPNVLEVHGRFTFDGGTGRYAGANGGGIATGKLNTATGDGFVDLDGVLSLPEPLP